MAEHKSLGKRGRAQRPAITARPRPVSTEVTASPVPDIGLSVDPEDLGRQFLSEATEQGNFESLSAEPPELSIADSPPSDEPLVGPNFDPDHSVWEQTVDLSLQGDADDEPPQGSPSQGRHLPPPPPAPKRG